MVREERLRKHVAMCMVREERQNRITQESPHPRRLLILSMWTDILPKTCMHGRGGETPIHVDGQGEETPKSCRHVDGQGGKAKSKHRAVAAAAAVSMRYL